MAPQKQKIFFNFLPCWIKLTQWWKKEVLMNMVRQFQQKKSEGDVAVNLNMSAIFLNWNFFYERLAIRIFLIRNLSLNCNYFDISISLWDKQSFHFNFSGTDIKFLLNFFSRNIIIFNCVFVPFSHRSKSLKLFFVDCKNLSLLLLPNITITLLLLLLFSFSTMALYNSLKNFIIFVTFVRCWEQEVEKSPII